MRTRSWASSGEMRLAASQVTYASSPPARARAMGLAPDRVRVRGLPIRPAFKAPGTARAKAKARKALGLDPAAPTLLLVGGGEGMGSIEATVAAIVDDPPPCTRHTQVVALCGRNAALAARLRRSSRRVLPRRGALAPSNSRPALLGS